VCGCRVGAGVRAVLLLLLAAGLAGACRPASNRTGEAFTATGELIALGGGEGGARNACFSCHGQRGQGDGVAAPRLAGLDAGYLQKQLDDYAADLRPDATMTPIARQLDHDDRRAVAVYYAALPPPPSPGAPPSPPALYLRGDVARGLPPCAACHGPAGEGVGPANPALAGQPAAYTLDQLHRWKTARRRNDPRGVMSAAAAPLMDGEMRAIAAWLATLPSSPPPASDAASLSAADAASARLAASRAPRRPGR
jgi:cytochrome c553